MTSHVLGSGTSSSGAAEGTTSAFWRYDSAGTGGATYNVQAPAISPNPFTVEQTDWTYYVDGANQLARGLTLTVNSATNTATDDFSQNGIAYHIDFAMESDGDTVDATFTQSNGVVSYGKYKASQIAPTTSTLTSTLSNGRVAMGTRHAMGGNPTAAKVAAVAGLIGAVGVAVSVYFPPAAPIAAPIAAAAGVVCATAVVIDVFTPEKVKH